MNRQEALIFLNTNEDDLEDRVQSLLFEFKNFVFQNDIIPQLFSARLKKLSLLAEAVKSFEEGGAPIVEQQVEEWEVPENIPEIIELYRAYELAVSEAKGRVNSAVSLAQLCAEIKAMIAIELARINALFPVAETMQYSEGELSEIKISEFVSSGKILTELKVMENLTLTPGNIFEAKLFNLELMRIFKLKLRQM